MVGRLYDNHANLKLAVPYHICSIPRDVMTLRKERAKLKLIFMETGIVDWTISILNSDRQGTQRRG